MNAVVAGTKKDRHVPHAEKQREETPEQKQAFDTYFLMGEDRSYRKLAKHLGKGVTTISNWAKWFDWQTRIDEREGAVNKIVEERINKSMAEIKIEQAQQIDLAMAKFWKRVNDGKIEIENWTEYEKVWKIRQEIGGETERKRSSALSTLTEAIARVSKTIVDGDDE